VHVTQEHIFFITTHTKL